MPRLILTIFLLLFGVSITLAQSDEAIKAKFTNKDYSVFWGKVPFYPTDSLFEIGAGNGHGGSLRWIRFVPNKQFVDILVVSLEDDWYKHFGKESKWPSDDISAKVKSGKISRSAYRSLLNKIALVSSARLKPISRNSVWGTSGDFWVSTRIIPTNGSCVDYDWAGYSGSLDAYKYAKPSVIVDLANAVIDNSKLESHELTASERKWASGRFETDWSRYRNAPFYWWVTERYIMLIGFVGDKTVIPELESIMDDYSNSDIPEPEKRYSYYAINALSRIIGEDVREKPPEQMDLERSRSNIHKLLRRVAP